MISPPTHSTNRMARAAREVDRRLAEIARAFDFLRQVTPTNTQQAYRRFRRSGFRASPAFQYRALRIDAARLKRRLEKLPVERIEDPALACLFRQRQVELQRMIAMLGSLGAPGFLTGSLKVYGGVDPRLGKFARRILHRIPPRSRQSPPGRKLDAGSLLHRAAAEIRHYRRLYPSFRPVVAISPDFYPGLLVSRGNLLIGRDARVPAARLGAILQHEIGTHLLTYYNGRAQPLRQLSVGLAGYDRVQEGLAVLSEYLVGGLGRGRLRLLAARVRAVEQLVQGASFSETFRFLRTHGFARRTAYIITMRVYRGGGLTKDAVYLRGLVDLLDYLRAGGELEPLWVGKIAADHLPLLRDLQDRGLLRRSPLRPRYLDNPRVSDRLLRLRQGLAVEELAGNP